MMIILSCLSFSDGLAQELIANVYGRDVQSLNGKWDAIVDQYDQGRNNKIYLNKKPQGKTDFYEYSFDHGLRLNVPSDWNSQSPELKYYEGTVWYARRFDVKKDAGKRIFLYFGAVSYRSRVYLNGKEIGSHEGGFTPFQIEVTDIVQDTGNFLAVEVNNTRKVDAIPAMAFDWWNYGGITRDVFLVSTPRIFIEDYFIQLDKLKADQIHARIQLSEKVANTNVQIHIPELHVKQNVVTDNQGFAKVSFKVKNLERWSPESPRLYKVILSLKEDKVEEMIGFRNLQVKGEDIYLNGKPVFLKAISFHEEIPQRKGRAFSEADAVMGDENQNRIKALEYGATVFIDKPFEIEYLLQQIETILKSQQELKEMYSKRLVVDPSKVTITSMDEELLIKAMGFIESNISNPYYSVDSFVSDMNVGRTILYQKINDIVGMSIKEFILNIRLKRSANLLEQSDLTVAEVAYQTGFNNAKYFSVCFKKQFDMTPSEYKKRSVSDAV